jgi:hypothetical protein
MDGRLYLVLGWPQLAVVSVVLVAVLWAMFQAGARSTLPRPDQPDDLEAVLSGAANPTGTPVGTPEQLDDGHRTAPREVAVPPAPEGAPGFREPPRDPLPARERVSNGEGAAFQEGRYYVRVQCFPKSRRQSATAACDFLKSKGIACRVRERRSDLALFATDPFAQAGDAARLIRTIQDVGREYAPIGGYDFSGAEAMREH